MVLSDAHYNLFEQKNLLNRTKHLKRKNLRKRNNNKTQKHLKMNTLNIVPENPDLVLIALNPTLEAIKNDAIFSRDQAFWNLLFRAGIISDISKVELKLRAMEVFKNQKYSKICLGFADLLPLIVETNSKKVVVPVGSSIKLLENTPNLKNAKRIALMGQKVVDAFAMDFPNLKNWKEMGKSIGKRHFGNIGTINTGNSYVEIFAMPFPINNNLADKHEIYMQLI